MFATTPAGATAARAGASAGRCAGSSGRDRLGRQSRSSSRPIREPGLVFVSAGAGTGKTTVLVERYVKDFVDRGLSVDSILVITYTERAAGELKERIRARLRELGRRRPCARDRPGLDLDDPRILLAPACGAHPFEAGLDPRFRVLDESQARVIQTEAFAERPRRILLGSPAGASPAACDLRRARTRRRCSPGSSGVFVRRAGRSI